MSVLISAIPSLFGVVVGGLITFFIQRSIIIKQQKWDKKKIELDNFYKNEEKKFQAYNKILQNDGNYRIHDFNHHTGKGLLVTKNYNQFIRPILYDVFHILDEEVAVEVNNIEEIFERQYVMEDADENDDINLSDSYLNIISSIKTQFKILRESKKNIDK